MQLTNGYIQIMHDIYGYYFRNVMISYSDSVATSSTNLAYDMRTTSVATSRIVRDTVCLIEGRLENAVPIYIVLGLNYQICCLNNEITNRAGVSKWVHIPFVCKRLQILVRIQEEAN